MSDILAKIDPKNEEEEKRRIEARREKQRRRREKNSEKYGDGYRFVLNSQKIGLIKKPFSRKVKSVGMLKIPECQMKSFDQRYVRMVLIFDIHI